MESDFEDQKEQKHAGPANANEESEPDEVI